MPASSDGEIEVTHEITLERLFTYSSHSLSLEQVNVGEKFVLKMNPKRLASNEGWWTWGALEGELKGKKFAQWWRPDANGEIENLMPGEKMPDVEGMEREGWVFGECDALEVREGEPSEVVVEFVE